MTSPAVGLYSCRIARPVVDLPQPLSPTRPRVSPRLIWSVTPSTALFSAIVFWNMKPAVTGKYIFRPRTSRRTSPLPAWAPAALVGSLVSVAIARWPPFLDVHPAGGEMVLGDRAQGRELLPALVDAVGATGVERAALGQMAEVGRLALNWHQLLLRDLVQARDGPQEPESIGMP